MPSKDKKTSHKKTKHEVKPVEIETIEEPVVEKEVIEKIVYKKQRVHGFFRTLTILVLLLIGFLMLGESMGIATVTIGNFALHSIYPLFVIFSTIVIRSYRDLFGKLFGLILFLWVFGGFFTIRIYYGFDDNRPAKFGEQIVFQITWNKAEVATIKTLATNIDLEGNTKSPYLQGRRDADRDMTTSTFVSGGQQNFLIQEDNTLNLLEDFVSNLTLYIPTKTDFKNIYIRNARGVENINTQDMNRRQITLNGGINKIVLDINNIADRSTIEIQWAIQDIIINIPKGIAVQMNYRNRIGYKSTPELSYQTGYLYTTNDLATAKKILTLNVNVFIGRLKINWK